MSEDVKAALIGAGAALLVILARDLALKLWEERRRRRIETLEVFRRYADPLASAASSLLWRLDEILNQEGRGAYLLGAARSTTFAQYKRLSTTYRIAALLGWIRAFRRELSFLRTPEEETLRGIKQAIGALEAGLADGAYLEERRLKALLELWSGSFDGEISDRKVVEVRIEQTLKDFLHESGASIAEELPAEEQQELCRRLARVLESHLGQAAPGEEIVRETRARAIQCLSLREAWIYRDWQAAIGDLMIRQAPAGSRLFEVIGYGAFEELATEGEPAQRLWIERLASVTDDLDVSRAPRFDVRVELLRNTLAATARLVRVLAEEDPQQRVLLQNTIELARKVEEESDRSARDA